VTERTKARKKLPGLISGTVDYEPGNSCPRAQMTLEQSFERGHGQLVSRARADDPSGSGCVTNAVPRAPRARMTPEALNEDHGEEPGREARHAKALALAVEQSRHEWCRLLSLTHDARGDAGVARLLGWAADPTAARCAAP
jgi:hypothetical protein